tara:strand:- start:1621 stop:2466 length:846 start_codon:yes stop_codon:yes gene_type:complete
MVDDNITIVINTFKSEDKIFSCLDSINAFCKVIIIENSDNIDLKKKLENKYSHLECYLTGENLGYANGNNYGLSKVKSKYALILNPDTTLESQTLNNFLNTAKKYKDFAIIGPAKQDEFNNDDPHAKKDEVFEANHCKGFAMLFNLVQFREIGFFDSNFFIYLEEIDLCRRLKQKQKKIYLDKKIKINHLGGSSHNESINFEMELSRNWHWMWSTFYYNKKHFGYFASLIRVSKKFFSSFVKMIYFSIIFKEKKRRIYYQRFSGLFNSIIGKKSWYRPKII